MRKILVLFKYKYTYRISCMQANSTHADSFIVNQIRKKTKPSSSKLFNSGYLLNSRNSGTFSETVAPIFLPLSPPQQKIKKKPYALVGSFPPSRSSATTPTIPAKARNVCRSRGNARCHSQSFISCWGTSLTVLFWFRNNRN